MKRKIQVNLKRTMSFIAGNVLLLYLVLLPGVVKGTDLQEKQSYRPAAVQLKETTDNPTIDLSKKPAQKFKNPVKLQGQDPWVVYKDGYYYFAYAENDGSGLRIVKSTDLTEIGKSTGAKVWKTPRQGWNAYEVWAPELHHINGKWFVYYTACDGNGMNHRMGVLESKTGDPQGEYIDHGQLVIPGEYTDRWEFDWAIDGTVLQKEDGTLYFVWSGWPNGRAADSQQNLYIAPMSDPRTISGDRVCISEPQYPWENSVRGINEGPQILKKDGKIMVVYSANASWTNEYCLGLLVCSDGNVMNPASWIKKPEAVFSKDADNEIYGVGHASFVKSPDETEDWIVYHAQNNKTSGWGRNVRIQKFTWNSDGTPYFGKPLPIGIPLDKPGNLQK
ncbi:MAG: glycoside hydrolase family 43 protein [Clostridia bacterium]|nr:glycoside hydrolase family 43 protein [Clostridia bacterium]